MIGSSGSLYEKNCQILLILIISVVALALASVVYTVFVLATPAIVGHHFVTSCSLQSISMID